MTSNTKGKMVLYFSKAAIIDLIVNKKNKYDSNPMKAREEGFNVYIMGANEERIRNVRKNEQIDRNFKSHVSNSRSVVKKNILGKNLINNGVSTQNPKSNFLGKKNFNKIRKKRKSIYKQAVLPAIRWKRIESYL